MAKIKKPTVKDYEKQSKGQGIGTLVGQSTSTVTHV